MTALGASVFAYEQRLAAILKMLEAAFTPRFSVQVKGGAAASLHMHSLARKSPELSLFLSSNSLFAISDLDIEVTGSTYASFVRQLVVASSNMASLFTADEFKTLLCPILGRSARHVASQSLAYGSCTTPFGELPSGVVSTLHEKPLQDSSGNTFRLSRICTTMFVRRVEHTVAVPFVDVVYLEGDATFCGSLTVRSVADLHSDILRMIFDETRFRPWETDRSDKMYKRLRRLFGLFLVSYYGVEGFSAAVAALSDTLALVVEKETLHQKDKSAKTRLAYLLRPGTNRGGAVAALLFLKAHVRHFPFVKAFVSKLVFCFQNDPLPGSTNSLAYVEFLDAAWCACVATDCASVKAMMYRRTVADALLQ